MTPSTLNAETMVLENQHLRIELDARDGMLVELKNRGTGLDYLRPGKRASLFSLRTSLSRTGSTASRSTGLGSTTGPITASTL